MDRPLADQEAIRWALAASEARLELATSAWGLGVWDWDLTTNELIYSDRAKEIFGFALGEPVTLEMVAAATHPDDMERMRALSALALDPAVRDHSPYEYRIMRTDGQVRWVISHGETVFHGERPVRYVGAVQDITEQKKVAQELVETNARLRLAMEAGRMAVWDVAMSTGALTASPELCRLLGYPPSENLSMAEVRKGYRPGDGVRVRAAAAEALARGEHYFEVEFRYDRPDGAERWMQLRAEIAVIEEGAPAHVLGVLLDVTDRKEAEDRLKLLAREVDHRANNLLAVAQATVKLSQADSVPDLKNIIEGRIAALAQAHNLLSDSRWQGANLRRLIEEELKPYLTRDDGKVAVSGPDLALRAEAAQSIAMALHELATNAIKYGALSSTTGRLSVEWSSGEGGDLSLRWAEAGAVGVREPTRRGFGMGMVERAVAQMKGRTAFEWREDGLTCDLHLPAEKIVS